MVVGHDSAMQRLGRTPVVRANDTPNFIANRIGTFHLLNAISLMMENTPGGEIR